MGAIADIGGRAHQRMQPPGPGVDADRRLDAEMPPPSRMIFRRARPTITLLISVACARWLAGPIPIARMP